MGSLKDLVPISSCLSEMWRQGLRQALASCESARFIAVALLASGKRTFQFDEEFTSLMTRGLTCFPCLTAV